MTASIWSKETLLDITVNIIPLGMLVFFLLFYIIEAPWGMDFTLVSAMQILLIAVPIVGLIILTYESAKRIEG